MIGDAFLCLLSFAETKESKSHNGETRYIKKVQCFISKNSESQHLGRMRYAPTRLGTQKKASRTTAERKIKEVANGETGYNHKEKHHKKTKP
ncbi:hypothetical protein [Avibacterium paragallinarum]|uniref:hypothetical protein n=1 Tax=Avibacterium paragallinarum TaxID=728 RepID=UPI00188F0764|nr:hypothetical protein [Avibacterium paragallinarum]